MKTSATKTVNEIIYARRGFDGLQVGDVIYQMESTDGGTPVLLGTVESRETHDVIGTTAVTLVGGLRLTRRGWQSKRLWVAAK